MSSPLLLLETISIIQGIAQNIGYHNQRLNRSRRELYGTDNQIELNDHIYPPNEWDYRCRVVYGKDIESIEYIPYTPRDIQKILIVESDIEYSHKYLNRSKLDQLLAQYSNYDDILIAKDRLLTDTTIANVAFLKDSRWYTPKSPLLHGTTRQRLIDSGFLSMEDIDKHSLVEYDSFAIMNAMIGFKVLTIDTAKIYNVSAI